MQLHAESLSRSLLNIVFPPVCPLCQRRSASARLICAPCEKELKRLCAKSVCQVCGHPFVKPMQDSAAFTHTCPACIKERPSFFAARSGFLYNGNLAGAIRRFKYHADTSLAKTLGELSVLSADSLDLSQTDLIVPVPLHKSRLRQRGFNQSLLLAKHLSKTFSIPVDYTSLTRIRNTRPQVKLKGRERRTNMKGAFLIATQTQAFKEKSVLLVDDVYTTGATTAECSITLTRAGAKKVRALTLARAVLI